MTNGYYAINLDTNVCVRWDIDTDSLEVEADNYHSIFRCRDCFMAADLYNTHKDGNHCELECFFENGTRINRWLTKHDPLELAH